MMDTDGDDHCGKSSLLLIVANSWSFTMDNGGWLMLPVLYIIIAVVNDDHLTVMMKQNPGWSTDRQRTMV